MVLIFGCLRRIVSLIVLAAVAPADAERSAEVKLRALESASPPARTALSGDELQALVRTRFSGVLPRWVDSARIQLEGDKVRLSGRVPVDRLPQVKDLGQVAGLLPDTTEVAVSGQVIPLTGGRVALAVDQVTAAHIPLPRRLNAQIIGGLRRGAPADLPPDALPLPLPRSISSAYVRGDSLVLLTSGSGGASGAAGTPGTPYSPPRR